MSLSTKYQVASEVATHLSSYGVYINDYCLREFGQIRFMKNEEGRGYNNIELSKHWNDSLIAFYVDECRSNWICFHFKSREVTGTLPGNSTPGELLDFVISRSAKYDDVNLKVGALFKPRKVYPEGEQQELCL